MLVWPLLTLSYVPGAPLLDNLHQFGIFMLR
ncbi:hypothetical protein JOD67_000056 [Tenggerimyces flavus]|nr:hypothetical protein [Tenggerimyces flavus]